MPRRRRKSISLAAALIAAGFAGGGTYAAASDTQPTNDAPNPYRTIEHWAKLPDGRKMGSTSAVDIDKDGKSVWVVERCGANSCLDRATGQIKNIDTVLKLDTDGNVLKGFGDPVNRSRRRVPSSKAVLSRGSLSGLCDQASTSLPSIRSTT